MVSLSTEPKSKPDSADKIVSGARWLWRLTCLVAGLLCATTPASAKAAANPEVLRLATTTSTADSGLLNAILGDFENRHQVRVDVIAVGTGQALALGRAGDADVLLVHARDREEAFLAEGHGSHRQDVMFNDFVLVGPREDPPIPDRRRIFCKRSSGWRYRAPSSCHAVMIPALTPGRWVSGSSAASSRIPQIAGTMRLAREWARL